MRPPPLLAATLVTLCAATSMAADAINIRGIDRGRAAGWSFVDNGWHTGLDTLRVRFNVTESLPGAPSLKGGFFDADAAPLAIFDAPPRTEVSSGTYQFTPDQLSPGRTYEIFFAVPPSAAQSGDRWKTFVVEVASGGSSSRAAYPASVNADDFALDRQQKKEADPAITATPVIKRVTRFRNGMNAWMGHEWKSGLNTLKVTVRIDSGSDAGGFFARAYFYDGSTSKLHDWPKPPQVEVKLGGTYAALPSKWSDGEDYDLYFPIPEEIDRGANRWKTAIVVFGNAHTAAATAYPASSTDLTKFDFPERDLALKSAVQ